MNIVVATCKNRGIGINNKLPWRISADMNFFKYLTIGNKNNAVVMGKNTFESLPQPLKNRDNIVVSTTIKKNPNLIVSDKMFTIFELHHHLTVENCPLNRTCFDC